MALDDYVEPEVGIAVALTAIALSPRVRAVLRRAAVYTVAGALVAGDALASFVRGLGRGAQVAASTEATPEAASEAAAP
jgi:hypothetical protein